MPLIRWAAVISIPILMFTNYYLTLLGKKYGDNVYLQHFTSEQYSAWQEKINKFKLNYKHVLYIILITGYFYFASLLLKDSWFDLIFGALFSFYAYIIMRNCSHILTYKFANKNPDQLTGKIIYGHIFSIKSTQYHAFTRGIFLLFLFGWTRSWFLLGGAGALLLFSLAQIRHINAYKKKMKAKNQPPA